jgi:predicted nuclease of predicted toxin-antitoxin system
VKILLDACVWGGVRSELQSAGHDVDWAGEWPEDPGDEEILERAHREGRVLVTLDKDFGELAIVHGTPHSGIIRLVNLSSTQQAMACFRAIELYGDELEFGVIITVEPHRIRIRSSNIEEKF